MATEIILPKVDMVMETGTFVEWLKKEGEAIQKGEALFVIQTDKAAIECEATESGILAGLTAKPDDVIPVTGVIGYILAPGEKFEAPAAVGKGGARVAVGKVGPDSKESAKEDAPTERLSAETIEGIRLLRATPLARSLAHENGVDLSRVAGRGPRGRIYKSDVIKAIESLPLKAGHAEVLAPAPARVTPAKLPDARIRERLPLKGARQIIAQRMSESWQSIPHINESISVNMAEIVRLREKVGPAIQEATGQKVTYTALIALAVARTLTRHPTLNSSLHGEEIILWQDVNLGLATSLEDYLIVPVIRQAQDKNLEAIVREMGRLLEAARSRKLEPVDMTGSTFTITNLGMFGIESFTAIINPPEAAILAVGKMVETPKAVDGQVVICPVVNLTVAADHRINDGVRVAKFLLDLKACLENPYLLL
jgi:pyruvate dehydrogenase E2 component (dihydrolipoamide acetyltransferase)